MESAMGMRCIAELQNAIIFVLYCAAKDVRYPRAKLFQQVPGIERFSVSLVQ